MKPVMLPPGRDRLATKPLPIGSVTFTKIIGMVRVCWSSAAVVGVVGDEFLRETLYRLRVSSGPASVDPDVAALRPPGLL